MEKLLMAHSNIDDLVSELVSHPADFENLKLNYSVAYNTAEINKESQNRSTVESGDVPETSYYSTYYQQTAAKGHTAGYQGDPYNQSNIENHPFESLPVAVFNQSISSLPTVYSHPLDTSIAYNRPAFGYPPAVDSMPSGLQNVTNSNAMNMSFAGLRMAYNTSPRNTLRMQNNNSPHYNSSQNFNNHRRPNNNYQYQNNNANRRPVQRKANNQLNRPPINQQSCSKISPNYSACNANYDHPPQAYQQSGCNQNYGYSNGYPNGYSNGFPNSFPNGFPNGQSNGQSNSPQLDFNQNCFDSKNRCDLNNNFSTTNVVDHCGAANCCSSHSQCHYKTGNICEFGLNCCATKDFLCNSNVKIDFRRNTFDLSKTNNLTAYGGKQVDRNLPALQTSRNSALQKQSNDRAANLRSFRPSNRNKQSKLVSPSPDLSLVIEACFDQLNELRKERIRLCKSADRLPSSTVAFKPGKTSVGDVVKFAMEEHDELAQWFDGLLSVDDQSVDPVNEILQTSYYSYQLWSTNIRSIYYAYKRSLVKLDERKISASTLFDANVERINDSSDLQCLIQLQQVPRTTKEVRKSIWCLSTIRSDTF